MYIITKKKITEKCCKRVKCIKDKKLSKKDYRAIESTTS